MALKRRIGFGLLTFYGVGVMVGAGIYVLVGKVAGEAGALTPLAFLLAGIAAGLSALAFAELSARIPESAGEAAYVREAFGIGWLGDLVGFGVAAVGVISAAAILKGGVGYLSVFIDVPRYALEIGLGVALGMIAIVGVLESLSFAALFTIVEILGLLAVSWAGFVAEPVTGYGEMIEVNRLFHGAAPAVLAAALLAFFAFVGFEDMVNLAEETVDPVRTMPKAIIVALAITTLLYCLVSVAAIRSVEPSALAESERPLALVFERGAGFSSAAVVGIAVFATLNGVLAQMVMAARVLYGLGRRNRALAWAHAAHPRFGTPVAATVVITLVVILLAQAAPIDRLASVTTTILLGVFILVNVALIALKRRSPSPAGAPNTPIWAPFLAIALSLLLLFG